MEQRRPKLEEVVSYRLAEMHDLFTSGASELTGKLQREYIRGEGQQRDQGEVVGRFGGVKSAFPELRHVKEGPGQIAAAIQRGKGPLFDRVYSSVAEDFAKDFEPARTRSRGKPTVRPHKRLRRYCVHCRSFHTKDAHRFHGRGSYHRTHLWGFKNPDDRKLLFPPGGFEQAEGTSKATLARDEREADRMLYAGRGAKALRHGKTFDRERLESSPLFAPTRKTLFTNVRRMNASQTFAGLMALARRRKLTAAEKKRLAKARQSLRLGRRPAMNKKRRSPRKTVKVRAKRNPAPSIAGRRRIGRIVELRYDRDTGRHRGFYKHTFKTNASVYILPGNQGILIR